MVTTLQDYSNIRYRTTANDAYGGVVRVMVDGYYGTGSLLFGGQAVLTSAHIFNNTTSNKANVLINGITYSASHTIHQEYNVTNDNNDLALLWLEKAPPPQIQRYDIYRTSDEITKEFTMVGYGALGYGSVGAIYENDKLVKLKAQNRFDADFADIKAALGGQMQWNPQKKTQLAADFDNGRSANDALGIILSQHDLGLGLDEGFIAAGDSGGPAFIDGKIAGVASYTARLSLTASPLDIDELNNSSFGEIASWQRVSYYQEWIDKSLREHYKDLPLTPADVKKSIQEGDAGAIDYVYFLLEFRGKRESVDGVLSVTYSTRDATAVSGEDYIATSGTVVLYEDENYAFIPVEIIGDNEQEEDEFFYLDVYNPIGGSFAEGIVKLTATRTILDNDTLLF